MNDTVLESSIRLVKTYCIGDIGTTRVIETSIQEDMLESKPLEMMRSDITRDMLVLFALNYARHAAPKDGLRRKLKVEMSNAGEAEGEHKHKCHVDFLTTSDIAYAIW